MRMIVLVAAGLGLAGCSSFSTPDFLKSTPPSATIQLESQPPGAEARTSSGQTCKTPCSVSVPAENLTVTFSLPKYQPETVPVQISRQQGGDPVVDPNPVSAELQPAAPPPRTHKAAPKRPKAKPKAAAAPADAAPAPEGESSPFPAPSH